MHEGARLVMLNAETLKRKCHMKWNFHSAFFFAGTVATTIGYGSLVPETVVGKVV